MFFQVSPGIKLSKQTAARPQENDETAETPVLLLAPFTPNAKIFFDDIEVGKTAVQKLIIKNPTQHNVELHIENSAEEINATLNWTNGLIKSNSEVVLEISWKPLSGGSWRFVLVVKNSLKIHKNVPVVFKSVDKKVVDCKKKSFVLADARRFADALKNLMSICVKWLTDSNKKRKVGRKVNTNALPTYHIKRKSSVARTMKRSPSSSPKSPRSILPNITNHHREEIEMQLIGKKKGKENSTEREMMLIKAPPKDIVVDRRETYVIPQQPRQCLQIPEEDENVSFEDSLETPKSPPKTVTKVPEITVQTPTGRVHIEGIATKLHLDSFAFSPVCTPRNDFNPSHCSTDEKTMSETSVVHNRGRKITFVENCTFDVDKGNESGDTYIKGNLSTTDFSTVNNSAANVSCSTYVKDCSVGDIASLVLSPVEGKRHSIVHLHSMQGIGVKGTIEANLWSAQLTKSPRPLITIHEEHSPSVPKRDLKRKSDCTFTVTPPPPKRLVQSGLLEPRLSDWSRKGGVVPLRLAKKTSGVKLNDKGLAKDDAEEVIVRNHFMLAAAGNIDPFVSSSIYCDEEWMERQQVRFKRWLNALLTIPTELNSDVEGHPVNVTKLWRECKKKEVAAAPSKEQVSIVYHTNSKLTSLRKAALTLFRSEALTKVLAKVIGAVDLNKLEIRQDRSVHLDLGLQSEIMSALLSYNPLWLRIGLETIYNTTIPLTSNSDLMGLGAFLSERFFRDPYLLRKHKTVHSPKYGVDIKKFVLKKFLVLIYFLDQAKMQKLIPHDPCLFCRNAPIKESREILLKFARETLSAVGDITKYLKLLGYVVRHRQTYINEFDYAVNCLGIDLRDGVRLTRVMEIILIDNTLSAGLRVPAISRLQKIHNMKIVFDALEKSGFEILYEISPKDIVDGHKEKTLSFLWQIIYKFQAPIMIRSAKTIQTWWRSDRILNKRKQLAKIWALKNSAATKIQLWFKNRMLAARLEAFVCRLIAEEKAAVVIQKHFRRYVCQKKYKTIRKSVIAIQKYAREFFNSKRVAAAITIQSYFRMYLARKTLRKLKYYVLIIEDRYTANCLMKAQRNRYEVLKKSALLIQSKFRAYKAREEFLSLKCAAIEMQRRFRANCRTKIECEAYKQLKSTAVKVQRKFRATREMRVVRSKFLQLKWACIVVQSRYKAQVECRNFLKLKSSALIIQHAYRAYIMMKAAKAAYYALKQAAITIQRRYKANHEMKEKRDEYASLRAATIVIQRRFRATKVMKLERTRYVELRKAVILIQTKYRAFIEARSCAVSYARLRTATIFIQRKFRAELQHRIDFGAFQTLKKSTIFVQNKYRAKHMMKCELRKFQITKQAAVVIQKWYRSVVKTRADANAYQELKAKTVLIQTMYRAKLLGRVDFHNFQRLKMSSLTIQHWYRACLLRRKEKDDYEKLKKATVTIQTRFKAKIAMQQEMKNYQKIRSATVVLQRHFRAKTLAKAQSTQYRALKSAAVTIQRRYRALIAMNAEVEKYTTLRVATITIQRLYRAKVARRIQFNKYNLLKSSVLNVQKRYRAKLAMREELEKYQHLKKATLVIQKRYRAMRIAKIASNNFKALKSAAVVIQRRYRARLAMKRESQRYMALQKATVTIQMHFRALRAMKTEMKRYHSLKLAALVLQNRYRAKLTMKVELHKFRMLKAAAVTIQKRYRSLILMRSTRDEFSKLKSKAIEIQRRYRGKLQTRKEAKNFRTLRGAAVNIQRRYRATLAMKAERQNFDALKSACVTLQTRYRAKLAMRTEMERFQTIRNAAIIIQKRYRANVIKKIAYRQFCALKHSAVVIQRRYRTKLAMIKEMERFRTLRKAVVTVQKRYRATVLMTRESEKFKQLKLATVFTQKRFREKLVARKIFNEYQALKRAAEVIQKHYRALRAMRTRMCEYKKIQKATLVIQKKFRANVAMKNERNKFIRLKKAAVSIQSRYRAKKMMQIELNKFQILKQAVIIVQRRYRAKQMMRTERERYQALKRAAISCQKLYKAKVIGREQLVQYRQLREAAVFIQRRHRANQAMKMASREFVLLKRVAVNIQRRFRAKIVMKEQLQKYCKTKTTAIFIQQKYRAMKQMIVERNRYVLVRNSTVTIQTWFRATLLARECRNEFLIKKQKAVVIQKWYRSSKTTIVLRQAFLERRTAALKIQRFYRNCLQRRETKRVLKVQIEMVLNIQRYARRFLIRKRFREALTPEAVAARRVVRKQRAAAVKIQAAWRGYQSRSLEKPELEEIRQRSKLANANATPQNTLGYRYNQAVEVLNSDDSSLVQIIRCLTDLEFITRRCKTACLEMSINFSEHLYLLICCTNRSLPEMQSCTEATQILINFCKYPPSRPNSWISKYIDSILTIMMHWCDKEAPLFPALCTLLWLFAHTEDYKKTILEVPNLNQKMIKMQQLCTRKQNMVRKVGVKGHMKSVFASYSVLHQPSLIPDWGLDCATKPKTFVNSLHAFNCLTSILNK